LNLLLGSLRQKEIGKDYLTQLDKHIADLKAESIFENKRFGRSVALLSQ
jgi:hypothetical protein